MPKRPLTWNLWPLVPLTVLLSAAVATWQRERLPTRTDWRAAAGHVRENLVAGDGVTWAPYTQGEGRLAFDGLPVFHTRDVATADLGRYDRLWLIGALGRTADDLPPEHERVDRTRIGPLVVDLVRVGGPKVVGDLMADLERAVYSRIGRDGQERRCEFWSGRGWHCDLRDAPETTRQCLGQPISARLAAHDKRRDDECGLDPVRHASRDVRLIGDTPRHCIFFHPIVGTAVRLTWPGAPAGDLVALDFGFSDPMVEDNYRKDRKLRPGVMRVLRDSTELFSFDVPATKGWHHEERDLPAGAGALAFELTTTAPTADGAHFCFDPTIRLRTRPVPGDAPNPATGAAPPTREEGALP